MRYEDISKRFERLATPVVADAVVRLGLLAKIAPGGIKPLFPGSRLAGPASPVVLNGYADRVLEGIYRSERGDVLLLDNQGRVDEACFGDLAAYEASTQGLAGVVIWGRHRDSAELQKIGVPVFSYGTYPLGLQRTYPPVEDPFAHCHFEAFSIERGELVFADDDGVVFVPREHAGRVLDAAEEIGNAEQAQVDEIRAGRTLREQLRFDDYLREKKTNPALTLGEHMKRLGRHF